jgi:RNA recognition motif-containing protein
VFWYLHLTQTHKNCGFVNFVHLQDAMTARSELNGREISGSIVKIGFAKVPSKGDPGSPSSTPLSSAPTSAVSETPKYSAISAVSESSPWRNIGSPYAYSPTRLPSNAAQSPQLVVTAKLFVSESGTVESSGGKLD